MDFTLIYLVRRFFYRVFEFLRHWYVKSFSIYSHTVINFLEQLDKFFALRVTLRHLFQPLYKDYSFIGYVLGFFFRIWRVIIASLIYAIIIVVAIFFYVVWLLTPVYIIYRIFI